MEYKLNPEGPGYRELGTERDPDLFVVVVLYFVLFLFAFIIIYKT